MNAPKTITVPLLFLLLLMSGPSRSQASEELTDAEIENLVRRSYQYVAMYNVNNKFAMTQGGWNTVDVDTELKDHTMKDIARPNVTLTAQQSVVRCGFDCGPPSSSAQAAATAPLWPCG